MSYEPIKVRLEGLGHIRGTDEKTDLDVSRLSCFGEVGGANKRDPTIDDQAFGVKATR
jgi:hypothetical protein